MFLQQTLQGLQVQFRLVFQYRIVVHKFEAFQVGVDGGGGIAFVAEVMLFCDELAERRRDLPGARAALAAVIADGGASEAQVSEAGVGLARLALDPAGPPDPSAALSALSAPLARGRSHASRSARG